MVRIPSTFDEGKMIVSQHNQLSIWKLGMEIARDVYSLTLLFPKEETFGLTSQMRRAAVSIPSNVAEGFSRYQKNDFKRFLQIALGSCSELATQLALSHDFKFIRSNEYELLDKKILTEQKMLKKFIKNLNLSSMDHAPRTMDRL